MSTSITFDQLEGRAERTLAVVLWAKHAKNVAVCAVMMSVMNATVKGLVGSLNTEALDALSREQAVDLTKKLQELHAQLNQFLEYRPIQELSSRSLFRRSIQGLEEGTEDLFDIIENLVLSENREFQQLLSECVSDVNAGRPAGSVAQM